MSLLSSFAWIEVDRTDSFLKPRAILRLVQNTIVLKYCPKYCSKYCSQKDRIPTLVLLKTGSKD